jgi:hypothetical protein
MMLRACQRTLHPSAPACDDAALGVLAVGD